MSSFNTNDGRTLLLNVNIEAKPYTLINVYAPNDIGCRSKYVNEFMTWISNYAHNTESIIMSGDCNCCLNATDRSTKTHINKINPFFSEI